MDDDKAARHLADVVRARMKTLRRSRRQVTLHGGPTEPTMLKIERGVARNLSPSTLRKLNVGLDWAAGSAENVYFNMGGPKPLRERTGIVTGPPGVYVYAETITQLITVANEIGDIAESEGPVMQAASKRLSDAIQPLYARYVTQLLEANRRQGGSLGPLVTVLGPFLDRPIDPTCDDVEEALYRRWLAGTLVEIDEALRKRFEIRLAEASA